MNIRGALLAAVVAAGSLILFASPASAQYDDTLSCSFDQVVVGQTVTDNANGFLPGSEVRVAITDDGPNVPGTPTSPASLDSAAILVDLGIAIADANGRIDHTFVVPDLAPGNYFVTLFGLASPGDEQRILSCPLEVVPRDTGGPIAFTGSESKPLAQFAIGLIAAGALAVVVARRRKARVAAQTSV